MKPRLSSSSSSAGGGSSSSSWGSRQRQALLLGCIRAASWVRQQASFTSCCRPRPVVSRANASPRSLGNRRRIIQWLLAVVTVSCLLLVHDITDKSGGNLVGLRRQGRYATADETGSAPSVMKETILRISDFPPRPVSNYEERWPGYDLPPYAQKPFFMRQFEYPATGCFVHVGKTAGSSLGCALGFQLHCQKELKHPRGYLPRLTTNLLHSDVNDCTLSHDYYLFSVRNPLERIQSWYVYEEKKLQPLIVNCSMPTLNDVAELGLERVLGYKARLRDLTSRNGSTDAVAPLNETLRPPGSTKCRYKSRRIIRGTEKLGSHAYYNYGRYMTQIPDNATIGVIRTPHLVQDYNSMEAYLTNLVHTKAMAQQKADSAWLPHLGLRGVGSMPPPPVQVSRLGSKNRTPLSLPNRTNTTDGGIDLAPGSDMAPAEDPRRYLSDRARELLCSALCDEIQVYKRILRRAVNLQESDVQQSLAELRQSCPIETDLPGACLY